MLAVMLCFLQLGFVAAGDPSSDAEQELVARVNAGKAAIVAAPDRSSKIQRLNDLKHYLATAAGKLAARNPAAQRRLRFTVEGLRLYLDYLDSADLACSRCTRIQDQILYSADPRSAKPGFVPGEAQVALDILKAICSEM